MTTSDKTGEKLVASMRRTKTSATTKGDPTSAKEPAPSHEAVDENAAAEAATAVPAQKPNAVAAGKRAAKKNEPHDRYRSKTRVWPD